MAASVREFNVRTDVDARDCTRGYTHTVRESALEVISASGRKKERKKPMTEERFIKVHAFGFTRLPTSSRAISL